MIVKLTPDYKFVCDRCGKEEYPDENERLKKHEIAYETPSGKQTMPNLLSLDGDSAELYKRIEDKVKSDTVRKMQEMLLNEFPHYNGKVYGAIGASTVDWVTKKMLEGKNED